MAVRGEVVCLSDFFFGLNCKFYHLAAGQNLSACSSTCQDAAWVTLPVGSQQTRLSNIFPYGWAWAELI